MANMNDDDEVQLLLLSGSEAAVPENLLGLFERLVGRPATPAERAQLLNDTLARH